MKKSLLIIGIFLFAFLANAQIIQFSEDFETLPLDVSSSGSATWDRSSSLSVSGMYSDSVNFVNVNDLAFLTTNAINITGYTNINLSFEQICKIELFDSAHVEISIDNGTTWIRLVDSNYLGTGQFGSIGNRFNSASYALDWFAIDNSIVPTNSWWKTEVFDLSAFAGSYTQFKVRFVLKDGNSTGASGNYGWLIDDIMLTVSNGELNPPTVALIQPMLEDTIYGNGPFEIYANVFDASGIDTAMIEFTIGNLTDTVAMTLVGSNLYKGIIPSQQFNSSVSYKVVAIDASVNSNVTNTFIRTFVNVEKDIIVFLGSGTGSSYKSPFYNGTITDVKNRSSHISLVDAADLAGIYGKISKISFEKYDNAGYTLGDAEVKIYLKHSNLTTVPSNAIDFYAAFTGATLVFNSATENIPAITNKLEFNLTTGNFEYDGSSNILVMVEWYRPSTLAQNFIKFKYTYISGKAFTFFGDEYRSSDASQNGHYPNMELTFSRVPVNNDVALYAISDPSPVILLSTNAINVQIRNSGDLPLMKATIDWEVDYIAQPTYVWNGNMQYGIITNDINIGSYNFTQGPHSIKVWAHSPNDLTDDNLLNDTLRVNIYACTDILNGYYTVGGSSADFIDLPAAMNAIMYCGMNGPTTIALNDGNYSYNFNLDSSIPGLDSINTLTFTSVSSNPANVVINSADESDLIVLDNVEYISFTYLTLKNESETANNMIYLTNSSAHITFDNCIIDMPLTSLTSIRGLYMNTGISSYITITNNTFNGGGVQVYLVNSTNTINNHLLVSNNTLLGFSSRALYVSRYNNSEISNNIIRNGYDAANTSTKYAIYLSNCAFSSVIGNDVLVHNDGAVYGIYLSSCSGSSAETSKVYNNISVLKGNTTSSAFRAFYISSTSYIDVINNTFISYAGSSTSETVYINNSGKTNVQLINNIIVSMSGAYAIETASTSFPSISNMDYNSYYTTGPIVFKFSSTITVAKSTGIAGIQAATSLDTNSILTDPMLYSIDNARSFSTAIANGGTPISYITHDINGNLRSTTAPSIGAGEFTVSTTDAGVLKLLNPIALDTQSRVTDVQVVVRNFGTNAITAMNLEYVLDGGTPVSFAYTGNIAPTDIDTISIPNFTIPVLDYTLDVYTILIGDTNYFNDSIHNTLYGMPLIEVEVGSFDSPNNGCDKSNAEIVSIAITNNGLLDIENGLTASYKVYGTSAFITENVTDTLAPGQTIVFNFAQTVDMFPGSVDSTYNFIYAVNHSADPLNYNDSSSASAISLAPLVIPVINDTTINYGDVVTLNAISYDLISWYESDTSSLELYNGSSYTTPLLFDTTTYWLQSNANIPPSNVQLGASSTMYGYFDINIYSGGNGSGKHQLLYTADELLAGGLIAGEIESISFETFGSFGAPSNFKIFMAHTTVSNLVVNYENSAFVSVFDGTITPTSTWIVHTLTSPFIWDGTSNIVVQICATGIGYARAPMYYTTTSFQSVNSLSGFMGVSCNSTLGTNSTKRPNTKFKTKSSLGCSSPLTSTMVNVPHPQFDAAVSKIVSPITDCGINLSEVSMNIVNQGTDTLVSGYTASYKINSGAYITPEIVTSDIAPGDTLLFVFNTIASMPAAITGTNYIVSAKIINSVDTYAANDFLSSDSIMSLYTPTNPIVSNQVIQFGHSALLSGTASDSLFWYADSMTYNFLSTDNPFTTAPIYDTTIFYVNSQRYSPDSTYQVGTGTTANSTTTGPSPYGAGQYGARHQFIILASELNSMGVFAGYFKDVAFDVGVVKGNALNDYTIRIGTTQYNDLNQLMFESNLTTVYGPVTYVDFFGWNTHNFSTPFYWDGVSNIIIETVFKNNTNTPFAIVNSINTTFKSSANRRGYSTFDPTDDNIAETFTMRPNIKITLESIGECASDLIPVLVEVDDIPTVDAGLVTFAEPITNASSAVASPVKVVLANYGTNNLTAATINWSEKGVSQTPYTWTGIITNGNIDTITIDPSYSFAGGTTQLRAWINVTSDTLGLNDTIENTIGVCLNGTYTIGSNNNDYISFTAAVLDLTINGICGPVVFNVDSGLYTESIVIDNIAGSNSTNTITFQSLSADSNDVLMVDNTHQNKNYIVRIKNMQYVTFKNMSFNAIGSMYGNLFDLQGHTEYITISNNNFNGTVSTSSSSRSAALSAENVTANNIVFSNNNVNNTYSAVYFKQTGHGNYSNITVENNSFNNFNSKAIYFYYADSVIITNNTITNYLPLTQYGIYIYNIRNGATITSNTMVLNSTLHIYGIYGRIEGTATNSCLIANNTIAGTVGSSSTGKGIYLTSSKFIDLYHNSVNYIDGSQTNVRACEIYSGNDIRLINNSFAVEYGYVLYCNDANSFTQVDYNNYHVGPNATKYVYWSGAYLVDLTALKTLDANKNAHSLGVNPEYISNTDLHSMQISLYNTGLANTLVTVDMDGETRSTTAPSIGADEFYPAAIDLSAYAMVAPLENSCDFTNSDTITVNIKNFGMNNINFATTPATITTYIDGAVMDTITYVINTGTLASTAFADYNVTTNYDFSANSEYTIYSKIYIASDAVAANDVSDPVSIISFPSISTFPFVEDFESGKNITFVPQTDVGSDVNVSVFASSNSSYGLHFEGGSYSGWSNSISTVEAAFATDHVATAYSCSVDATSSTNLSLKFDLKQTVYNSITKQSSWFRVILDDATGSHYLANVDGDTVFQPTTVNQDVFVNQIFNLDNYTGQVFSVSFEAAMHCEFGYGSADGDNVLIDNIIFWEPSAIDLGMNSIVQGDNFGPSGTSANVTVALENFGLDTLFDIPLAYQVDANAITRDTFFTTLEPNERDTFTFAQSFNLGVGNNFVTSYSEYAGDAVSSNDTVNTIFKGMITVVPNYTDDFESSDNWIGQGDFQQWELGSPTTANINTAHSGINVWATNLSANYTTSSIEYLYTPYITIPTYTDTATIEFYQYMRTISSKAYGTLEYTVNDGATWSAIGYIGIANSNNWYSSIVFGQHVWNTMDNAWKYSSIELDPTVFNTGIPVQFRFKFTVEASSFSEEGWAIDDFKIFFPSLQTDAGIAQIVLPTDSVEIGTTQVVTVKIKNFGTDTIFTTDVKYETGAIIVTENYSGMILSDSIVEFTFNQGFVVDASTSNICATTLLTGDMQIINDELCKSMVATQASYDAGISSIHAPFGETTIDAATTVKVYITNYGTEPITSCDLEYTVSGINSVTETFTGNILSNDSAEFVFTSPYISLTGAYTVCATTQLANDADASNDIACVQVVGTDISSSSNEQFVVLHNQPNPAKNNTVIEYYLPKSGGVIYSLINVLGETIINKESTQLQGKHQWNIDANSLSAGVYYYTLTFDEQSYTYKMIVVK